MSRSVDNYACDEVPLRTTFGRRSPTHRIIGHNPYGMPERDRYISHKSPLQPRYFDKLNKASQFPTWEKRVTSAISSIHGYGDQLLNSHMPPNSIIQEQILKFLIQTVYDIEGLDLLCAIESTPFEGYYSTRGRDAWQALRGHYHQVNNARISELLADFNRPQQPQESVSDFINRIINKRLEIKRAGTEVPHDHARSLMIEGLREEYQPAISFLRVSEFESLDTLRSKVVQVCSSVDNKQKSITASDSTSLHFGSPQDAFGYHQPRQHHPHSVHGGRNITPKYDSASASDWDNANSTVAESSD